MKPKSMVDTQRTILDHGQGLSLAVAVDRFIIAQNGVKSEATIIWYRSLLQSLVDCLGDVEIERIEIDDLRQWRGTLAGRKSRYVNHPKIKEKPGPLSPTTLHSHVRACRTFFRWLVADQKLAIDPSARLELPPKPERQRKGIGDEDRMKILEAVNCKRCQNRERDQAMLAFLDDSTCRASGVVGLETGELFLEERSAYVHEKGLGGNRRSRWVFFSPDTADLLRAWLKVRPKSSSQRVFVTMAGEPLEVKGLYQVLRRAAKRAGIARGWNPHNWRHGTIRRMKRKGINMAVISQLAGHKQFSTTADLYGTLDEMELRSALDGVMWPDPDAPDAPDGG